MIDETALIDETQRILDQGEPEHTYNWTAAFHIPGYEPFIPLKIEQIVFYDDYVGTFGERVKLTCTIPKGVYVKRFLPHKANLIVQISQIKVFTGTHGADQDSPVIDYYYKALPEDIEDTMLAGNSPTLSEEDLNRQGIVSYNFECIHPAVYHLRAMIAGTMARNQVPGTLLHAILDKVRSDLPMDMDYALKGVSMVPPDNTEPREQFMVSHRRRLKDFPKIFQTMEGGIYTGGIASYIKKDQWYIFPPFNTQRFDDEQWKMVLVNLPPNRFTGVETTYGMIDKVIVVLLTNRAAVHDDSELNELNLGNGLMYLDSSKVIHHFAKSTGNEARVNRASNMVRYGVHQREDGNNYAPFSDEPATSNHFSQISKLARRNGVHMEALWENSDPSLVYPGMPVKLMYIDGSDFDVSSERYGVLIGAEHDISSNQKGVETVPHSTNSYLKLFLERE